MTKHKSNSMIISLIMAAICFSMASLNATVTQLTDSGGSNRNDIAADNNNNAVIILVEFGNIYVTNSIAGGLWSPLLLLSNGNFNSYYPHVAMDATGTAIAIWTSPNIDIEINTAYYVGGIWTTPTPQPLDTAPTMLNTGVAMNGLGQGLGVWSTEFDMRASFFSAGSWASVDTIDTNLNFDSELAVSYSPSGNASVLWFQNDFDTLTNIFACTFNGVVWSTDNLDSAASGDPDAGIDAAGNTIAVWATGGNNDIVSSRFNGTSWSSPVTLSTGIGNGRSPRIAVDSDGTAIAVWWDGADELQMIKFDGTIWGAPVSIASNLVNNPSITMNANGDALIGWTTTQAERLYNVFLPKNGVLALPVLIRVETLDGIYALRLALSSDYGFDSWLRFISESSNTFGSSNLLVPFSTEGDCYAVKSATGEVLAVESTMIAQLKFSYNTNTYSADTSETGLATITYDFGLAIMETLGAGSATIASKIRAYAPAGQGVSTIFTATFFDGDETTSGIAGLGNETDGFFFGSVEGTFGILHRNNSVDTFIPQSLWNVDTMDGTGPSGIVLDTTFGNVYKIQYQRLEFGNINFYIESAETGQFILVNQIQYTNNNTSPSLTNPGLQLMAQISSDGGDIYMELSSMGLYIEGEPNYFIGIRNTVRAINSFNATNTSFISIRNDPTFFSITNQLMVIPDELSLLVGSDSLYDAVFSLYLNPTLGTPTFTQVNSNSCVSYSTDSIAISDGTLIGRFVLAPGSEAAINIGEYDIQLCPGDVMVIACFILGPGPTTLYASTSWLEQF